MTARNGKSSFALLVLCVALVAGITHADGTFRCGNWIASSETSLSELIARCGKPTTRESRTEDVKTRNSNNGLMVKIGETTVETWVYDRGANPAMVVTIVDGQIKSDESRCHRAQLRELLPERGAKLA